jgi:hypothetical protein
MHRRPVRWLCVAIVDTMINDSSLSCCKISQRAAREGWLQAYQGMSVAAQQCPSMLCMMHEAVRYAVGCVEQLYCLSKHVLKLHH